MTGISRLTILALSAALPFSALAQTAPDINAQPIVTPAEFCTGGTIIIVDGIREMLVYISDIDATKKYACAKRIEKAYSRDQVTANYLSFVEKILN